MSVIAAALKHMMAAGMDPAAIVAAVADMEAAIPAARSKGALRTEKWRRNRHEASQTSPSDDSDGLSLETKAPTPPKTQTLSSSSQNPPKGGQKGSVDGWPEDFREQFWDLCPNKVGKAAAIAKLEAIRKRRDVPWERLIGGLRRYAAKTDDRPWCNPLTWLNQGRWDDAPAGLAAGNVHELRLGEVPTTGPLAGKFYAHRETPQFEAWDAWWRRNKNPAGPAVDRHGGRLFDSEWPPGFHLEAAE